MRARQHEKDAGQRVYRYGVFTPVWHGLCARVPYASGCISATSEVGTVLLYTIVPGSAVQFNRSVSAMPPKLPQPFDKLVHPGTADTLLLRYAICKS